MRELERLGRVAREQLGEPPPDWLQHQSHALRRAFASRRRPARPAWLGRALIAATVALVLVLAVRASTHPPAPQEVSLTSASGERRVTLADGSSIALADHARARLTTEATATRCVVELGLATFDVAPQGTRTFAVIAGQFEIRVIGTRFSVSRDANGLVEVRVAHGVVRVHVPERIAPLELRAGDYLRGDGHSVSVEHPAPIPAPMPPPVSDGAAPPAASPAPEAAAPPPASAAARTPAARDDWRRLYAEGDYAGALAAARQLGTDELLASLPAPQLAELADAARLAGENELALQAFDSIARRFPASRQARDATFLSGRILAKRGQTEQARARFEGYLARNSRGAYAIEALGRLVELYAASKDPRAPSTAKAYLERAPHGPYERLCRSVLNAP
jgi:transmembrane sensor